MRMQTFSLITAAVLFNGISALANIPADMKTYDSNNDGKVTKIEFIATYNRITGEEVFKKLDRDNNSMLNHAELAQLAEIQGHAAASRDASADRNALQR